MERFLTTLPYRKREFVVECAPREVIPLSGALRKKKARKLAQRIAMQKAYRYLPLPCTFMSMVNFNHEFMLLRITYNGKYTLSILGGGKQEDILAQGNAIAEKEGIPFLTHFFI